MKNADMPAMPVRDGDNEPANIASSYYQNLQLATGLTKREMMAMAAMQGLCAHSGDYHKPNHIAMDAVMFADALISELERTKCQS